jgi:hypothetical protein
MPRGRVGIVEEEAQLGDDMDLGELVEKEEGMNWMN